ncbi:MAG: hypothetical protein JW900_06140 [Anaerolineae bacterium]|nr:hypothetical protein [Anaerolineae bacterium]
MNFGLLWFDNDSRRGLKEKVLRAADHYQQKYGQRPNLCFVHPSMLKENGDDEFRADGVQVRSGRAVLPHHFWIGVADK